MARPPAVPRGGRRPARAGVAPATAGEPGGAATGPPAPALRILMVASEAYPYSKTGGLADVSTALSRALGRLGHEVTLFTPCYRSVEVPDNAERLDSVRVHLAGGSFDGQLIEVPLGPGARMMLVDCPALYDRAGIYNEHNVDYPDNPVRFAFLSLAALEWAGTRPAPPSVLHAHDWQAGLLPVYARPRAVDVGASPCVFTLHNLAYQGTVNKSWVPRLALRWEDFSLAGFEFWDRLSFLKAGLMFSDAITTVSPTYAEEIQRPEYGYGLDGVMRRRASALVGILNGIEVDEWDPARDPHLPAPYDAASLAGKREAKRALLQLFGLPSDAAAMERPIVGMVSRQVEQKGLDLVEALAGDLPRLGAAFTVVGSGEWRFEQMWRELAARFPDRIGAYMGFDERRAHLVEAGADLFLMPSRFEPCGLNQMYSMRYGTVPVVRAVGGLVDTVRPYDPRTGEGTGFLFSEYSPGALLDALRRALETFRQPRVWKRLQANGMQADFSWDRSASEYVTVYKRVIAARRTGGSTGVRA